MLAEETNMTIENNNKTEEVRQALVTFLSSLKDAKDGMEGLNYHTSFPLFGEIYTVREEIENLKEGIRILKAIQFKSVDDLVSVKRLREAELFFSKNDVSKDFKFPEYQSHINPAFLMYVEIEIQLDALDKKALELFHRGYKSAGEGASWIVFNLRNLNQWFFQENRIGYDDYRSRTIEVIHQNRSELDQHRGYKKLLGNLILLILTLGTAFIVNKAFNGHFLFFQKTDSAEQLDNLNQTVHRIHINLI